MIPKKKILISIIVFGIINILFVVFLIYPLLKTIKKNSQAYLLERERIALLVQERENLEKMEKILNIYQSDLDKIQELFLNPEALINFINFLEENANASQLQLKISSIESKKIKEKDPWPSLILSLSVTGSFPNSLKFLDKLENAPYLIEILTLNITRLTELEIAREPQSDISDIKMILLLKVFTK